VLDQRETGESQVLFLRYRRPNNFSISTSDSAT
jgi:hypothetical protein